MRNRYSEEKIEKVCRLNVSYQETETPTEGVPKGELA